MLFDRLIRVNRDISLYDIYLGDIGCAFNPINSVSFRISIIACAVNAFLC